MNILLKYPTRNRINICFEQIQRYISYATNFSNIKMIISLDDDDFESIKRIDDIKNLHENIEVFIDKSNGKVNAINRNIPDPTTFDILVLISDDMVPIVQGYDDIIINYMTKYYPDTDGVLFFNDGYVGPRLNTLAICGSKYYQRFNYIYCPLYYSFYCDNEFMDSANKLNKQKYIHQTIIKHEHPVNVNKIIEYDDLYKKNDFYYNFDKQLYYFRYKYSYDITVLICTIPKRKSMFDKLLNKINYLLKAVPSISVEILFDDSIEISIGVKRTLLLNKAQGKYCCFIDDDDDITTDYFKLYENVFNQQNLDFDCVSLNGNYFENGNFIKPFFHSIKYKSWFDDKNGYYRCPNHLNLIKTEICKTIGFIDTNFSEDFDFSKKLFESKLIKKEFFHNLILYNYYKINN